MSAATPPSVVFELKSAALPLVAVVLRTTDLALLAAAFEARFADGPALFDNDPVAIDLGPVREALEPLDFGVLIALLRTHRMLPIAAKGGSAQQMEDALAAGLSEAHNAASRGAAAESEGAPSARAVLPLPSPSPLPPADPPAPRAALVVDKPLRSGQRVYAKGADLIVLSVVSFGAEVIADGHIHVYAPLRGRALAGALGDTTARIFTTCLEPQLMSIAGIYRTAENDLAPDVRGRAAQVRLDGERLVVEPLVRD